MIGFYNYTVILTYLGVAGGVVGLTMALNGQVSYAIICLMFSGLCDAFDGVVARTKTDRTAAEKRYGIQIDSLQDVVCFGVLPAAIGWALGMRGKWALVILCLYVLSGLTRLAYFNVTEEQRQDETDANRTEYEGVPITTAALVLPMICGFGKLLTAQKLCMVYGAALVCLGFAYIARIRFPKIHGIGRLILVLLGLLELIWVLV